MGLAVWEGFIEEDVPAGGAGLRQAWRTSQWLAVSNLTLSLSTSGFPFLKGEGVEAEREETEKKQRLGDSSYPTSDRANIYSPIHEPGSGEHPQLGTPGFMLVSGLDVRPEAASV